MKKLFAFMARSDKKYADPTGVLKSLVDDFGNPIEIGDQKDIGEFNTNFLARLQEGLHATTILQKLKYDKLEEIKQDVHMSSSEVAEKGSD